MDHDSYVIHTDGSCLGNPGPGGIAVVITFPESLNMPDETFCRGFHVTNNIRMELKAGIEGLRLVKNRRSQIGYQRQIIWYTDLTHTPDNFNNVPIWRKNNWIRGNGEPVRNRDLWKDLYNHACALNVMPRWTPRENNVMADSLAKQAAQNPTHDDFGFNPGRVGSAKNSNSRCVTFFTDNCSDLEIRIYKGDGEVHKDGRCKIRFRKIDDMGETMPEKYYAYTRPDIYNLLHRHGRYILETKNGWIVKILEEN